MPIDHPLIVSTDLLAKHLGDPLWTIIDCRFDLTKTEEGEESYLAAHIPGAGYAHLDRDLSGTTTGHNGRHPLPTAKPDPWLAPRSVCVLTAER